MRLKPIVTSRVDHFSVNHGVGEFVREQAHTNGMESFWSMMKRGFDGTYHQMSPKHLPRYLDEFQGRHNIRQLDTKTQMEVIVRGMVKKRLPYKDLISGGPAYPDVEELKAKAKQLKKDISPMPLLEMFPDDETAEQWFIKNRWPDGIRCAHCDSGRVKTAAKHSNKPFRCSSCKKSVFDQDEHLYGFLTVRLSEVGTRYRYRSDFPQRSDQQEVTP